MSYIKCSHCGEMIGVKSEFMILCPLCSKRLDNSYKVWVEKNPGTTFEQYLSEMCVSELALTGLGEQRRVSKSIRSSRSRRRMGVAFFIAAAVIVAIVCGYYVYKDSQKGASINAILNDSWKIALYDDLAVTLKFPFDLSKVAPLASDSLTGGSTFVVEDSLAVVDSTLTVLSHVSRSWSRQGVAAVSATRLEFAPAFGVNREAATQQILQTIVQNNDLKAFEYIPSDYTMGQQQMRARMFSGSYLIKVEAYQFRAVMVVRGNTVWYFMVAYLRSMPEGTLLAEKFFNGILL